MRDLDTLFTDAISRQAANESPDQLDALAGTLIAGARRKRRVRLAANGALTLALSLGFAAAVWTVMRPDTAPVDNPTPTPRPSISFALSEATLNPVWGGSEPLTIPVVPPAFADGLDPASLPPLVALPGPNYPEAHQMTDAIWDAVEPGWSLQIWDPRNVSDTLQGPVNLYIASPSGTYFLVRQLGDDTSQRLWRLQSWSADPKLMVVYADHMDDGGSSLELQDLRTGDVLRHWGGAPGEIKGDYTLMETGFSGGRTVTAEFANTLRTDGQARPDGIDPGGRFRIYGPDGAVTDVPIGTWQGGNPALGHSGADGSIALLYPAGGPTVTVLDLDERTTHQVTLQIPADDYCSAFAPGADGAILGQCGNGDTGQIYRFASDGTLVGQSNGSEPGLSPEFSLEGVALTDTETGAVVDTFGASALLYGTLVEEYREDKFALTDWGGPNLLLYDRASGATYVVTGDYVSGSRVQPAARSVAVLQGFVPDRVAFDLEWDD